jgi:predicted O-linked N-acetylglucosamine transferase (SPINDLY family)
MNAKALAQTSKETTATLEQALRAYNVGDIDVAVPLFELILEGQPLSVDALVGLGLSYWRLDRSGEGEEVLRKALAINPRDVNALRGLGLVLYSASKLDEAGELLDRCVATDPRQHQAWLTLGLIQQRTEDLAGAETSFKKALELEPHYAEAMNNLGTVYLEQRQFGLARALFMEAIKERPSLVDAYRSLAKLFREMGTDMEALAILKRAVRIEPTNANAWNEIGGLYRDMSDTPRSIAAYEKAIEVDPKHVDAKGNLSCVFANDGQYREAQKLCGDLLEIDPKAMGVRVRKALIIPAIMESNEGITRTREELHAALDDLKNYSGTIEDPLGQVGSTNFYLAYHGYNDRELQKKTADIFRQFTPILTYEAPHIGRRRREGKIRLGICSRHLSFHTIGILWADLFARLDRDRFEISLFHTQPLAHRIPQSLIQRVDHEFRLPIDMKAAREVIQGQELDILYYPDLGMEPLTYFLAFNRLAPVQCTTWGHPLTTGISTIDYFVSSKELELPHAQDHYTEELVKLDTLNTYYLRPEAREIVTRDSLGVGADANVYMCPQTLFKFHPDFDRIVQGVLEGDPKGELVLLEGTCAHHSTLIKERLQRNVPGVMDRIRFIPRLSHEGFLGLIKMADVMLDPIHFGGGSTTIQALSFGTPVVTLPSEFLRARISYACYRHMGVESLIAQDIDDYCRIAVELGRNNDLREATRKELVEKSSVLYSNQRVVTECEQFLLDVFQKHGG